MELDASTIVLQIVNFLILVWILQRLLYRPVLDAIARRRAGVEKTLADARAQLKQAQQLETEYHGRLEEWERERQRSRAQLGQEFEAARAQQMAALKAELDDERARQAALDARRVEDLHASIEAQALQQAAKFCARLLARMASPDLETRIVQLTFEDIQALAPKWHQALSGFSGEFQITTAHPLAAAQRDVLTTVLRGVAGDHAECRFAQDPTLIAGVRISAGGSVVHANLADELSFFAEHYVDG